MHFDNQNYFVVISSRITILKFIILKYKTSQTNSGFVILCSVIQHDAARKQHVSLPTLRIWKQIHV